MNLWAELGIAPTRDRGAIRRAYAVRLKATPPDSDPQGFARLRDAYEQALRAAEATAEPPEPVSAPVPAARPVPPVPATPPPVDELGQHLGRGNVVAAVDWLLAARPGLTLADDMRFTDRLGWTLAQDHTLPAAAVRTAAARLGWQDGLGAWTRPLRARLDAEAWLDGMQRDAAGARFGGGARTMAARMLLGRGPPRSLWLVASDPILRQRFGEYLLHAELVEDRFDAERIAAVREAVTTGTAKPRSPVLTFIGLLLLAWAIGSLVGKIDPRAQDGVTGILAVGLLLVVFGKRQLRQVRAALNKVASVPQPVATRLAFRLSLGTTVVVLGIVAFLSLAIPLLGGASGGGFETNRLPLLQGAGLLFASVAGPCLLLSRGLARLGWNTAAVVVSIVPLTLLVFGLLSLGSGG